jgi:hypothetical protein
MDRAGGRKGVGKGRSKGRVEGERRPWQGWRHTRAAVEGVVEVRIGEHVQGCV